MAEWNGFASTRMAVMARDMAIIHIVATVVVPEMIIPAELQKSFKTLTLRNDL
jgi:hypothetical protein